LLNRPGVPGFEPTDPLSLYGPLSGGSWVPLAPPPLPRGGCVAGKKGDKGNDGDADDKGKKKGGACGSGSPETVPEPGTWLLVVSGLAAMYWQARRKVARA
jgi:hypothetical protein